MFQEQDFDSDTSDEDFVPQGAESEDDIVSDVAEDNDSGTEATSGNAKVKKKSKKKSKKSKGNPLLANNENDTEETELEDTVEEEPPIQDKKKEEDLWADFLADTDDKPAPTPKPKANSWASLLGGKKSTSGSKSTTSKSESHSNVNPNKPNTKSASAPSKSDTVKITQVFDFAGEEVRVEKEVAADSAEAIQAKADELVQSTSSDKNETKASNTKSSGLLKRPGGLSSLIGMIDNKKQKLSTLEKTKLDWNKYKSSEGIVDELELHKKSKHGYLEKKEFLERTDVRQFEIERSMRMSLGSRRSNR